MNHAVAAPNLAIVAGRPCTTSLNVAEVFGKEHRHVIRAIESLEVPEEFSQPNFGRTSYLDSQNKPRPMYHLTKDGFTLLAMGFTGKAAMKFKLAYIAAFNAMEAELLGRADEAGRKRVDVNHSHLRATLAPGGLDIRYTLDLTKIMMRPTQKGLELLERVTGIEMGDLIEELTPPPGSTTAGLVQLFINKCCDKAGERDRILLEGAWQAYRKWFEHHAHGFAAQATRRQFAGIIGEAEGCRKIAMGGRTWLYGVKIADGEEVQHG